MIKLENHCLLPLINNNLGNDYQWMLKLLGKRLMKDFTTYE